MMKWIVVVCLGWYLIGGFQPQLSAAEKEAKKCGGIAGNGCEGPGEYCKYEGGQCGGSDGEGVCAQRPELCTQDYTPVCGCDGKTHSNVCQAARAGVSIAHAGECKTSGSVSKG